MNNLEVIILWWPNSRLLGNLGYVMPVWLIWLIWLFLRMDLHRHLRVFVYMFGLSFTTYALQIAFYISHTYCYQHMNFPDTLQHKNTQLIINSSTDIRSDLVLFNYFLIPQQIPLLLLFCCSCNRPTQFFVLFFTKKKRSNLLVHSFVNLLSARSNCFS